MPKTEKVSPHGDIWKPEKPGDKLVGTLEGIRETTGGKFPRKDRNGNPKPQTVMDFTTAEGAKSVFCDAVLEGYARVLEVGSVYMITFTGWGAENKKKKTEEARFRNYGVEKVLK